MRYFNKNLVEECMSLFRQGYSYAAISRKVFYSKSYVRDIIVSRASPEDYHLNLSNRKHKLYSARLTPTQKKEIYNLYINDCHHSIIASKYNISSSTVYRLLKEFDSEGNLRV